MFSCLFSNSVSINNCLFRYFKTSTRRLASNLMPNYYDILGLEPRAPRHKIKEAYQKLVQEYHPDKNSENSWKIYDINAAYEILSNDVKKLKYDETFFFDEKPKSNTDFIYENTEYYDPTFSADRIFRKKYAAWSAENQQRWKYSHGHIKRKHRHMTQKYDFNKTSGAKVYASYLKKPI